MRSTPNCSAWWCSIGYCWQDPQRSLTKAAQEVRRIAHEVALTLVGRRTLRLVLEELQAALAVGSRITLRRQRPSTHQLLSDPTLWEQALGLTSCLGAGLAPAQ